MNKGNVLRPMLSVVIANYNYGRFLGEAIESILAQGLGGLVEIIICDAASSDNSVEVIKRYADKIAWWCSEKDGGQSAAFNKGFSHAHGEWLTWLNADDLYLPGTLKAFRKLVERCPAAQWVTGNKVHFDNESGKILSVNWGPHVQPPFMTGRRAFSAVFGPTTFWKRSLYDKVGPIDEKLHYAMDTEYWARMTMAGVRQTRLNHLCWAFREHKDSKTEGVQPKSVIEKRMAETRYWQQKVGYDFKIRLMNPWYCLWCVWRILDGSWLRRKLLKAKYEGVNVKELQEK